MTNHSFVFLYGFKLDLLYLSFGFQASLYNILKISFSTNLPFISILFSHAPVVETLTLKQEYGSFSDEWRLILIRRVI